jgi:hypothetical protein
MLALLGAAGAGLALLLLVAARGRVAHPRLPVLRAWWTALRDGQLRLSDIVPARVRETVRGQARRLRLPSATGRERPVTESRRARQAPMKVEPQPSAAERARERARARATNRRRVNSR